MFSTMAVMLGRRSSHSLLSAFFVSILVPLFLSFALLGYITLGMLESRVERQMQEDVELIARAIRPALGHAIERERVGSVIQSLEPAFEINRVYSAYVFDEQGKVIAAAGQVEQPSDGEAVQEVAKEGGEMGAYQRLAGREVYSYILPLTDVGGQIHGLLQVTRRRSDFNETIASIRAQVVGGLALLALVLSVVAFWAHRRMLGKPLNALGESMEKIQQGDQEHRASENGPYEIQRLASNFNRMLNSLLKKEAALEQGRQEQLALERRLKHSEKLAAIGQLAAGVAHELGAPLSVIKGLTRRAKRQPGDEGNIKQIESEVSRMEHIVRQLLDFGSNQEIKRRRSSFNRLADSSLRAVRELQESRGVRVKLEAPSEEIEVEADPIRIEQAFVNLLRNAIQASQGGQVCVRFGALEGRKSVWFEVEDDGPGIDKSLEARIYEPFFTTKSVAEGTGLGLAVVHGVIQDHGGEVQLSRSSLGGARFVCYLKKESTDGEQLAKSTIG